ncbi:MAG: outer membrane beta-barrel protein [Rickettsiales bacterium]|nr:outer membrane beta-barrel protein [Rickettsiales bacterium]
MKKLSLIAFAAAFFSTAVSAEVKQYVGARLPYNWARYGDQPIRLDDLGISIAYGVKTGEFRSEFEFGYGFTTSNTYSYDDGTTNEQDKFKAHYLSYMVNGYWDIPTGLNFTPFIGIGLGLVDTYMKLDVTETDDASGNVVFEASDEVAHGAKFAWSVMAGLAFDVSENLNVDIAYKFLDTKGSASQSGADDMKIRKSVAEVGLRYAF